MEDIVYIPQEYLVLDTYKDVSTLKEADWAEAETPESFDSSYKIKKAASGKQLFVYTRYKETDNFYASTIVQCSSVITGAEGAPTQSVRFEAKGVNSNISLDQEGTYIVPKNTVIRVDELPIPDNATDFTGSAGQDWWLVHGGLLTLYEDEACTKPLENDDAHFYKTVYFKATETTTNGNDLYNVSVLDYKPLDTNKATCDVNFIVTENEGNVPLIRVEVNNSHIVRVRSGETMEFPINVYPLHASTRDIAFDTFATYACNGVSNAGTKPEITVDNEKKTITIDCSDTDPAFWGQFRLSPKGTIDLYVEAVEQDGIIVTPQEAVIDPTVGTIQLKVEATPANAGTVKWNSDSHGANAQFIPASVGNISWNSGPEGVVTIDDNGLVTLADKPDIIGQTVYVYATSSDFTAKSILTVGGQKYKLWIAGTQVHTYNQDDILGDGTVSFNGNTLTLNNATIDSNEKYAIYSELPNLNISLRGDNKILSNNPFSVIRVDNATVKGYGLLEITSE